METIWRIIVATTFGVGGVLSGVVAAVLASAEYPTAAGCFAIAACVLLYMAQRRAKHGNKRRSKRSPFDEDTLQAWEEAETREVVRPRDPRTKFCFANIGNQITVIYRGSARQITPQRIFTKPKYRKTYVQATVDDKVRHFDIDDMRIPKRQV